MPLIRVVSRMGRPLAVPMVASFGPGIGTLGRSPDCTLALPDEARHLSRQQARVEVSGNATAITCLSAANPLIINGQELRQGQTRRLAHGDRIHVAGYELCFEADGASASTGSPKGSKASGIPGAAAWVAGPANGSSAIGAAGEPVDALAPSSSKHSS